jgi:hypothetical protein
MAVVNRQGTQIATLDGYPFTGVGGGSQTGRMTGGQGAAQEIQQIEGFVLPVIGDSIGSYLQFVRLPSAAAVKSVEFQSAAATMVSTGDVTIGISDAPQGMDGTQFGLQVVPSGLTGTDATNAYYANPAATTTGLTGAAALFGSAVALGADAVFTDVTFANGVYTAAKSQQPLWQAAGYAQDPGGMFDIVVRLTAAISVAAGILQCRVRYTTPTG